MRGIGGERGWSRKIGLRTDAYINFMYERRSPCPRAQSVRAPKASVSTRSGFLIVVPLAFLHRLPYHYLRGIMFNGTPIEYREGPELEYLLLA